MIRRSKKGGRNARLVFPLIKLILEVIRAAVKKTRVPKPQPLCASCINAHVQYGANGRRAIFCTHGGTVRPMKLDVLYCTDCEDRNAPLRLVRIGFAPEFRGVGAGT